MTGLNPDLCRVTAHQRSVPLQQAVKNEERVGGVRLKA